MKPSTLTIAVEALTFMRDTLREHSNAHIEGGESILAGEFAGIDAALTDLEAHAAQPVAVALWPHERIEEMVEQHEFRKYDREAVYSMLCVMRDEYEVHANASSAGAGVDAPDSVGFWAWEEGHNRGVSEIYEGFSKELIVDEEPGGLMPDYYSGRKWYKLHMPWQHAPAPTMPYELSHQYPVPTSDNTLGAISALLAGANDPVTRATVEIWLERAWQHAPALPQTQQEE